MVGVGVIGYGFAGRCFHAYLVSQEPRLRLHAVVSRDAERRQRAAAEYGVQTYSEVDALLEDPHVELVVVATPHNTHAELTVKALRAGKHVVTDKVMAMNVAECDAMIAAAREHGRLLSVFHNRRWDWDYRTIRRVVESGWIGEPFLYEAAITGYGGSRGWRANVEQAGSLLADWGAHLIDHALLLTPGKVESVWCDVQARKWGISSGSHGELQLRFHNGVLHRITVSRLARAPKPRWYVLGEEGAIVKTGRDPQEPAMIAGNIDAAREDPADRARVFCVRDGLTMETVVDSERTSWKSYYRNIAEALLEGAELAVKPEEARRVVAVLDAAAESARTHQSVRVEI
ncbi:MAG: Gfo/Idh/MocA family oxidoreductase [Armatimonadota bacterium]|nr:Gfo/Idh/MocA family oxidoreductase [Armatimonadota bacterium]